MKTRTGVPQNFVTDVLALGHLGFVASENLGGDYIELELIRFLRNTKILSFRGSRFLIPKHAIILYPAASAKLIQL